MISFEWNETKNRENIEKRGIDFEDAISIFDGNTLERVDNRFDYKEVRIIAYGVVAGHVLVVVYTMRDDVCRIISARIANRNERGKYYAAHPERPPDRSD